MGILITAAELAAALDADPKPIVLDVRWRLDRPDGRPDHAAGHIPGAVYVDLDTELARAGVPADGRHPLPPIESLQAAARRWGISEGDAVVVYDDLNNLSAARAWWLLTAAGLADVRLLDGSLQAWTGSGYPIEQGDVAPGAGDVTLPAYGHLPMIGPDEAAALPRHGVLLDARAGERYRGETEPVDPRAGHIPGAVSAPTAENVDEHGFFLTPAALRARFAALGVGAGALAVYCGSGVTAAHEIAALTIAGFRPALYPGSWSAWSNSPERPVAVGPDPGGDPDLPAAH